MMDGLGAATGEEKAYTASAIVRSTLKQVGFVLNQEKSVRQLVQHLQWLGFIIDMALGQVEVPQEKLAFTCLSSQHKLHIIIPVKLLASIVGRIISMGLAVGPISRFMTHSLYACIESRTN